MDTQSSPRTTAFGRHMKQWRRQRGLSQLELATRAGVSQRHISFLETGRSRPREDLVNRVTEALEVPLRHRNTLLASAGLAPGFPEMALTDAAVAPFREAIDRMLAAQEPYPAYVINRWWDVVDANAAGRRLFPMEPGSTPNAVDAFIGPGIYREMIENFPAVAWGFLHRLRREVADAGPDERLQALLERAEGYLEDVPYAEDEQGSELVICPRLRIGDQVVRTISMVAQFGSVREVTLDELRVELILA